MMPQTEALPHEHALENVFEPEFTDRARMEVALSERLQAEGVGVLDMDDKEWCRLCDQECERIINKWRGPPKRVMVLTNREGKLI